MKLPTESSHQVNSLNVVSLTAISLLNAILWGQIDPLWMIAFVPAFLIALGNEIRKRGGHSVQL